MEKVKSGFKTSLTEAIGTLARPDEKTHQECIDMDLALLMASAHSAPKKDEEAKEEGEGGGH